MSTGYTCDKCGKKAEKVFRGKHYCIPHGAEAIRKFTDRPKNPQINWKIPVIIGIIATFAIGGFYLALDYFNKPDSNIIENSNVAQDTQDSNIAQGIENSQIYQNYTIVNNYFYDSDYQKEEFEKQQKEFEEKMESKDKVLSEMQSKMLNAYFDLIEIHTEHNNYDRIAQYANEILFYQPENVIALDNLGVALARDDLLDQSIKNYTKLLTIIEDDYSALVNNAWSLTQLERFDEALILLNKIETMSETDLAMLSNKCWVLHKIDEHNDALSYCKRALDQNEDDERALKAYSLSLSLLDRSPEALPSYKKLYGLYPDDLPTIINYANALSEVGQINDALIIIEQGLDKFPNQKFLEHNKKVLCVKNPQLQCIDS